MDSETVIRWRGRGSGHSDTWSGIASSVRMQTVADAGVSAGRIELRGSGSGIGRLPHQYKILISRNLTGPWTFVDLVGDPPRNLWAVVDGVTGGEVVVGIMVSK